MSELLSEAEIVFVDRREFPLGTLRIADVHRSSTIRVLDKLQAARSAEEKVQLVEGGTYDYQLLGAEGLEVDSGLLVQPNLVFQLVSCQLPSSIPRERKEHGPR